MRLAAAAAADGPCFYRHRARCSTTAPGSRCAPALAATARCRSAARRTSPRAVRTEATAAAAGTSSCAATTTCATSSLSAPRALPRRAGGHGQGAQRHGRDGEPLVIAVPPGTQVTRWDGTRFDLVRPGQQVTVARGGAGGRGNTRFKSAVRQAPRLAERGLPGAEGTVDLHLKLIADVGLVGLPNAGKSSLLARMTRAQPKVAAYPFTTLEPVLGTLEADDRQLVLADIPGLIEGASAGAGLGHDFLAHVERTRLLVHVLDLAPLDGSEPEANHAIIEAELAAHDPRLAALPRVLALSKADLVDPGDGGRGRGGVARAARRRRPVHVTSSATRRGLDGLARDLLRRVPPAAPSGRRGGRRGRGRRVPRLPPAAARAFGVERVGRGEYRVHRRRGRPPHRPPRPRERGGARPRRAAAAADGRDRGARGARASSPATTSRSAASSSSSTPAERGGAAGPSRPRSSQARRGSRRPGRVPRRAPRGCGSRRRARRPCRTPRTSGS